MLKRVFFSLDFFVNLRMDFSCFILFFYLLNMPR